MTDQGSAAASRVCTNCDHGTDPKTLTTCNECEGTGIAPCVPPGSDEALDLGCLCPVIDNGRGRGYLGGLEDEEGKTMFVVNFECPLHGVPTAKGEQVVAR